MRKKNIARTSSSLPLGTPEPLCLTDLEAIKNFRNSTFWFWFPHNHSSTPLLWFFCVNFPPADVKGCGDFKSFSTYKKSTPKSIITNDLYFARGRIIYCGTVVWNGVFKIGGQRVELLDEVIRGCWRLADRLLYWRKVVPTAGSSANQNCWGGEVSAQ